MEENNGTYYKVLGRRNESLYDVRSYIINEYDEPEFIENGYLTTSEVRRLKTILEGEGPCC